MGTGCWRLIAAGLFASAAFDGPTAAAHDLQSSQLRLRIAGTRVEGEWEIQRADARTALDLEPRQSGQAGPREFSDLEPALRAYLAGRLSLSTADRSCPLEVGPARVEGRSVATQWVFPLSATCPIEPARLSIHCDLLFDRDPGHRAYYSVEDARVTQVGRFRDDLRSVTLDVHQFHLWAAFLEFVRDGVEHVLSGWDHLLFLLALLLPAPLELAGDAWLPRRGFRATANDVLKIVTAFTLAHSLALCASFFGWISLRAQWIEVGIALSVLAAAWNNLQPFLPRHAWAMAFGFGLVHGLGFAGALRNLALPNQARGIALAAFNVGVELGQLAVVALVLPLLVVTAKRRWYPRLVMGAGSLLIAWLAAVWILERAFGFSFA